MIVLSRMAQAASNLEKNGTVMTDRREKSKKILNIVFLIILVIYPLRNIWLGVEVTDGAYSAGNYRFLEQMNPMWLFATYLGNVTGRFFTGLPGGHTLMGLRFYTALVVSATAVVSYLFFTKVVRAQRAIVFLGELLAISLCWCPTTILYNYLTYFFFDLGIVILYLGLVRERRVLLFCAGIVLGINVFVRFPNLTEAALICSVWYYGFLQRKRGKDVLQETGICLLGYGAGIGAVLLSVVSKYGLAEYMTGIARLLQMPSEAADYGPVSMVLSVLLDYKFSAKWLLHMLLLAGVGCLVSFLAVRAKGRFCPGEQKSAREENREIRGEEPEGSFVWKAAGGIGKVLFLGAVLVLFRWWYGIGVFNVKYYTYESMFQWVAVFLILVIAAGAAVLFSKKFTRNEKLLASMVLILIAVTPLGSNNHLYPNMNNMFLVFPFGLLLFVRFLKKAWEYDGWPEGKAERKMSLFPVRAMLAAFLAAVVMQSVLFGMVFTFRDGMHGEKRDTKIEKNAVLRGMVTNAPLAEAIEGLTEYVEEENLSDRSVILYGQIPAVSYLLDMPPAISTSWPDLASYHCAVMTEDMKKLRENPPQSGRPLIILGTEGPERWIRGEELTEAEKSRYALYEKWELLYDYMVEEGYEKGYENAVFVVYR